MKAKSAKARRHERKNGRRGPKQYETSSIHYCRQLEIMQYIVNCYSKEALSLARRFRTRYDNALQLAANNQTTYDSLLQPAANNQTMYNALLQTATLKQTTYDGVLQPAANNRTRYDGFLLSRFSLSSFLPFAPFTFPPFSISLSFKSIVETKETFFRKKCMMQ